MKLKKVIRRLQRPTTSARKALRPILPGETKMSAEGLIVEDEGGHLYVWQADGCACAHPEIKGYHFPCVVPGWLKTLFDNSVTVKKRLRRKGYPVSDVGRGMEAWLPVTLEDGREAVIVWNNSA